MPTVEQAMAAIAVHVFTELAATTSDAELTERFDAAYKVRDETTMILILREKVRRLANL